MTEHTLHEWFAVDAGLTNLIGGLGLIVTAIVNPEGMAGGLGMAVRRLAALVPRRAVRPVLADGAAG